MVPIRRLRRVAELAGMDADPRISRELLHETSADFRRDLLSGDVRASVDLDAPVRLLEDHFARARAHDPLNRLLYVYVKTYLVNELLRVTDAMSMRNSLEVRTPFLDYRLVELAMRMPAHHKMRLRTGKLLLRDVAQRTLQLPSERGKRGFSPPVGPWLRSPPGEIVREALSDPVVRGRGIFDPGAVRRLRDGCLGGAPAWSLRR